MNNLSKAPQKLGPISANLQLRTTSAALFNNQTALYIEHANETYVLRITRQGKLILTK